MKQLGLIEEESVLKEKWTVALAPVLESLNLEIPGKANSQSQNGRNGEHTKELDDALSTLGEVYSLNPDAPW